MRLIGKRIFLSMLTMLFSSSLIASTTLKPDIKIRAAYIYKFTKFISWPATAFESDTSNFVICVADDDKGEISTFLKNGLFGRSHKKHPLEIKKISYTYIQSKKNALDQCHILYITESAPTAITERAILTRPHLLTINSNKNINTQSIINFWKLNKRIIFSINSNQLNKSNINISATLLTLARNIEGGNFDQ